LIPPRSSVSSTLDIMLWVSFIAYAAAAVPAWNVTKDACPASVTGWAQLPSTAAVSLITCEVCFGPAATNLHRPPCVSRENLA
jgi:hypothetical protein